MLQNHTLLDRFSLRKFLSINTLLRLDTAFFPD